MIKFDFEKVGMTLAKGHRGHLLVLIGAVSPMSSIHTSCIDVHSIENRKSESIASSRISQTLSRSRDSFFSLSKCMEISCLLI